MLRWLAGGCTCGIGALGWEFVTFSVFGDFYWYWDGVLVLGGNFDELGDSSVWDGILVLGSDFGNFSVLGAIWTLGKDFGDFFRVYRCWVDFWTLPVGQRTGTKFQHSGGYVGFCGARCVFGTIV